MVWLVDFEILSYFDSWSVVMNWQEINMGIANLTVCRKPVWLVEFEMLPYFDSLSVVRSCQVVTKKIVRNSIRECKSNCMPKISLIDWVWNLALFWKDNNAKLRLGFLGLEIKFSIELSNFYLTKNFSGLIF